MRDLCGVEAEPPNLADSLGIVVGEGFYLLATICTIIALAALTALNAFEHRIAGVVYRSVSLVVPTDRAQAILARCHELLRAQGIRVQDISHRASQETRRAEITLHVRARNRLQAAEVIGQLMEIPDVVEARWL